MSLRVQGMSNLLAHDALFDALLVPFGNDQALHENAGRVDMVGIDRAGGKQLLDLRDREDRKSTRLNSVTNAHLVCRLLLEKKDIHIQITTNNDNQCSNNQITR